MASAAQEIRDHFLAGGEITYRELSERGGLIVARFDDDKWLYRHETEAEWSSDAMPAWKARAIFPTDAAYVVTAA